VSARGMKLLRRRLVAIHEQCQERSLAACADGDGEEAALWSGDAGKAWALAHQPCLSRLEAERFLSQFVETRPPLPVPGGAQ